MTHIATRLADRDICYVTNQEGTESCIFGDRVMLPLSEEAHAFFVIRASRDPEFQEIQAKLESNNTGYEALKAKANALSKDHATVEDRIEKFSDYTVESLQYDAELFRLCYQKAGASLRILRKMREEYQKTEKLSI